MKKKELMQSGKKKKKQKDLRDDRENGTGM